MDAPKCWYCKREYEEYVPDDDLFPVCPECLWDGSEANPRNRLEIIKEAEG